jgi:MoaA/NifB/PqqE/SkfB family radical SAM enzyme
VALGALLNGLELGARTIGRVTPVRRAIVNAYDRRLRSEHGRKIAMMPGPPTMAQHRLDMALAILHTMDRAIAKGVLGWATLRGALNIIAHEILFPQADAESKKSFQERYASLPPAVLTISPGKACNLRCIGCYADSGPAKEKLDWPTLNRLVWEACRLWGTRFFVFSGGEPLAYQDRGKGVLDVAAEHRDCFFLMYTNGTLIDDEVAQRLGAIGNLTPAISIEGMRAATDARRGAGIFDRIVAAMGRLRRAHVPFGISMTATRYNAEELLSDQVLDFFFEQMGAMYGWLFHYMPIGRAIALEMMPTATQRLWMMQRMWEIVGGKHYFLADFWNSGILSDGCISAGGRGGYLYVDWNGAVSPCVFVPYSPVNIHNVYAQGKTLNDVWADPFFAAIREWQQQYNPGMGAPRPHPDGNLLRPCPFRDHHAEFQRLLALHEPDPTDDNARAALLDPAYHAGMEQFDRELAAVTDPVWEAEYLGRGTQS